MIHCPKMDSFVKRLIDAHRRRDEVQDREHSLLELSNATKEIFQINEYISDHRYNCVICRRLIGELRRKEEYQTERPRGLAQARSMISVLHDLRK